MATNGPAMGWAEWLRHDATALAGLLRSGQLTAGEVVAQAAVGLARETAFRRGAGRAFAAALRFTLPVPRGLALGFSRFAMIGSPGVVVSKKLVIISA